MAGTIEKKKATVYSDSALGLEYVIGASKVLFSNGVLIQRSDYEAWKADRSLIGRMEQLTLDPAYNNYDFRYAVSTGVPRRKRNTADLEASVRAERSRKKKLTQAKAAIEAAEAVRAEEKHEPKSPAPTPEFSSALLLSVVMLLVGIGSAVMSVYHTTVFLIYGGKPVWTSVITGTMLILFSGTAFTAARHFLSESGPAKTVGVMFLVAGLLVIAYSMFSTLTVNYNQFKWRTDETTAVAVADNETLAVHERLLQENTRAFNEAANEIVRLEVEADYWKENSWKRYDEISARIAEARNKRDVLRTERIQLETRKPELVETASASQETVYAFLGRLFGLKEDTARFFTYVVPALLYDILAPMALTVVLMLADDRRRRSKEIH